MIRVQALFVFPVKSLAGIAVDEASVGDRGFEDDRRFMVVDGAGTFLTQRELPKMALVRVALDGPTLRLWAPGMAPLALPRRPEGGAERTVRVWRDQVAAREVPEAGPWLEQVLGVPCALVYMPEATRRPAETALVGFADGYPFLLASASSLEELGRRGAPVPILRFRPNIVVEGAPPFAEDAWRGLRIGDVSFRVVKPCARCSITNVDPETAEVGPEPLRTLARFRRQGDEVLFGQNLVHAGRGPIRVGDVVTLDG